MAARLGHRLARPFVAGSPGRRLLYSLATLALLTAVGTGGYMLVEHMAFLDALYMAVITLSTVGYGEVQPLSPGGRFFSIGLIMFGLGTAVYTVGAVSEFLLEGHLAEALNRRSLMRSLAHLKDHIVLCGFGRFGQSVADGLRDSGVPLVIVDSDPDKQAMLARRAEQAGTYYLIASALEDEVLEAAGLQRARAIVIATPRDADAVFIALAARAVNPDITIHARAETESGSRRLRQAGVQQVISPHRLGGQRVANALVRPAVMDFLELSWPGQGADIDLEEILLSAESALIGKALRELTDLGVRVVAVAIQRQDQELRIPPSADDQLQAGDRVVVVGEQPQLKRLAELAGGG